MEYFMFPFIINSGSFEKAARRRQLSPSNLSNIFRIYCKLQRRHDGRGWARAHTDKCGAELRHPDTGVTSQPCPPDSCSPDSCPPDSCPTVSCPPDSCPPVVLILFLHCHHSPRLDASSEVQQQDRRWPRQ